MGRDRFSELVDRFEHIQKDPSHSSLIVYGTRGYGKSHLLAALVCCLAATAAKVIYIPDCRELMKDPVSYVIAAMSHANNIAAIT